MSTYEVEDRELLNDVKEFVNKKIKDVKSVDDIFANNRFKVTEKMFDIKYRDNLHVFKKLLQLTINVYNNDKIYEDKLVKFVFEDGTRLYPLDCYNVHDGTEDPVGCSCIPSEDEVVRVLYHYAACFIACEKNQSGQEHAKIVIENEIKQCTFCDADMAPGGEQCDGCGATKEEIVAELARTLKKNIGYNHGGDGKKGDGKDGSKKDEDVLDGGGRAFTKDGPRSLESERGGEVRGPGLVDSGRRVIDKEEGGPKWKCGKCGLLSRYELANCEVCGVRFEEGRWTCASCTMENSCARECCDTCGTKNAALEGAQSKQGEDKKGCTRCRTLGDGTWEKCRECDPLKKEENVESRKEEYNVQMRKEKWKCGKCDSLYSYDVEKCAPCGATLLGSGWWTCASCTLLNKWDKKECETCGWKRDHLGAKLCDQCRQMKTSVVGGRCRDCPKVTITKQAAPSGWKCALTKCDQMNEVDQPYCSKCKLQRAHSRVRGDLVTCLRRGREEEVWICVKCAEYREGSELACGPCKEGRYKKRYCPDCKVYNKGTSADCDMCGKKLK